MENVTEGFEDDEEYELVVSMEECPRYFQGHFPEFFNFTQNGQEWTIEGQVPNEHEDVYCVMIKANDDLNQTD